MRNLLILFLAFFSLKVHSQILEPVEWSFETKYLGNSEFDLISTAKIDKGWYIYSQDLKDDGPVPTTFSFEPGKRYEKIGRTKESGESISGFDKVFDMKVKKFKNEAVFTQRIKLNKPFSSIKGSLEFMTCDDSKCLPPEEVSFKFKAKIPKIEPKAIVKNTAKTNPLVKNIIPEKVKKDFASKPMEFGLGESINKPKQGGILEPVKWKMYSVKTANNEFELHWEAKIEDGWYVYSQFVGDAGPVATTVTFDENSKVNFLQKNPTETGAKIKEGHDPVFDAPLKKFAKTMELVTKVKTKGNTKLKGVLEFMTCDHEKCLPPDEKEFDFELSNNWNINEKQNIDIGGIFIDPSNINLSKRGEYKIATVNLDEPVNECGEEEEKGEKSIFNIFFLGFLGGLVALLTPCVFPMIPLTVSFFTKGNKSKGKGIFDAALYGGFIFLIYILFSIPFHFLENMDPEIFNNISTNVYLNIAFFIIFVVFAISFFGYFEITIPSSIANKADSASDIGGLIGIFFMALTLALVSFSCTGPILGSLLAGALSSDGGAMQLTSGMGGFGLALGIPFTIFALFPNMLKSLPKSGGWLNTVKVVLGFLELALAVKFLSNADLVKGWGLLKREVFFGLWIIIGSGLVLYLFGLIRFPHDSKGKLGFPRIAFGVLTLAFVVYLIPGLSKDNNLANRSLLSGFPPPLFYSLYEKESNCPLDLACYKDYNKGMAYAKSVNKPVLVDFTGWACVNCRKMEENVWVKPEIFKKLNEEFVLISLYVDDKKELPAAEKHVYETSFGKRKKIDKKGVKWATMQTETFANNSQPYYAILSPNEILLNNPVGYKPDAGEYADFLDCGLNAFDQLENMNPKQKSILMDKITGKKI